MKQLQDKACIENIKAKQEKRYVMMEKERDWFRSESLRLNTLQKEQKKTIEKQKQVLDQANEELDYYKAMFFNEKVNNKELISENLKFRQTMLDSVNLKDKLGMKQSQASIERMNKSMLEFS